MCQTNLLYFRFNIFLQDGGFETSLSKPSGWFHIVLNYPGPNNGEGIRVFINGAEADAATEKHGTSDAGDGRVVIGRAVSDTNHFYGTS